MVHTIKGFGIINKAEIDVFLELSCFFYDPTDVDNLISYSPWNFPGQNTGVGSLSLLQGIFPTQGSNPDLPHCRWILHQLSHKGSPRIPKWVAYPFSRGSSQLRDRTAVSWIAGRFFTNWAIQGEWRIDQLTKIKWNISMGKDMVISLKYLWEIWGKDTYRKNELTLQGSA